MFKYYYYIIMKKFIFFIKNCKTHSLSLLIWTVYFQLFIYDYLGTVSFSVNVTLLLLAGFLVNGPYALITTAVSAELGTHSSLGGSSKALATVTSIIDGTGSIGAAVGPLLAGLVSSYYGWHNVFYMLMIADVLALCVSSKVIHCIHSNECYIILFAVFLFSAAVKASL